MEKTRWEYQIVKFEMPDEWPIGIDKWEGIRISHLKMLNEMGQQGWEYTHSLGYLYYFKRPYNPDDLASGQPSSEGAK